MTTGMDAARDDSPRAGDRAPDGPPVVVRLAARVPAWARVGGEAVTAGRVLLVFSGAVLVVGAVALGVDAHEARVLLGTVGALAAAVVLSLRRRGPRSPRATVAYPVGVLVLLGVLALTTTGAASAFIGLIPLCFVYLGLFHHGRTALAVLPVAWAAYLAILPVFDAASWIRLGVYGMTWWAIAQTLAVTTAYQRSLRRRLYADSRTDQLTSLANRRDLDERLAEAVPGDTVVIADLDHFKRVNDTLGHAAGDVVLERFGHAIAQHLRRRDYAARYGGEEFVLILPRTEPVQAVNVLRALRTEWAEEGHGVTFSAGIALITEGTPPGSALAAADVALYRAKNAGRDRFRIATERIVPRPRAQAPAAGP